MLPGEPFVILDVDDHVVYRRGLKMLLESSDPSVTVLEAGSLDEALAILVDRSVSIVLVELAVCGEQTADTVARIVDGANTPVVVFSKYACDDRIIPALQAGACGYVHETADVDVFLATLRRAAEGEYILDGGLVRDVVKVMRELMSQPAASAQSAYGSLTPRETDVLRLVCQGKTNRQISQLLGITESTVKNHMQTVFRKLRVGSRGEAAAAAIQRGLCAAGVLPDTGDESAGPTSSPNEVY